MKMKFGILLCVVLLVGCGDQVTTAGIERSVQLCEPHGGLVSVQPRKLMFSDSYPIARCVNGLRLNTLDTATRTERVE